MRDREWWHSERGGIDEPETWAARPCKDGVLDEPFTMPPATIVHDADRRVYYFRSCDCARSIPLGSMSGEAEHTMQPCTQIASLEVSRLVLAGLPGAYLCYLGPLRASMGPG